MCETILEQQISERAILPEDALRNGTEYLASLNGQIPVLIRWNSDYKKWCCSANFHLKFDDGEITHMWASPKGYELTCTLIGSERLPEKTFNLLIECELALDEVATIAKHCTEYKTKALQKECQSARRLAKKVKAHIELSEKGVE